MIFDTHAHYYDDAFDADRDALLSALPDIHNRFDIIFCYPIHINDVSNIEQNNSIFKIL